MMGRQSGPPALALWLLRRTCSRDRGEVLAGDLVERFREGKTAAWFWKEVLLASALGVAGSVRRRWPLFGYALAGTITVGFSSSLPLRIPSDGGGLPWPLSQLVFELSGSAIMASVSLIILAAGLTIAGSFRWRYLIQTWLLNLILIAADHFLPDVFPALLQPVPGDPFHKLFIIPRAVQVLFVACTFLVAAWMGCPMAARPAGLRCPTKDR